MRKRIALRRKLGHGCYKALYIGPIYAYDRQGSVHMALQFIEIAHCGYDFQAVIEYFPKNINSFTVNGRLPTHRAG